jgi:hypothetical protein
MNAAKKILLTVSLFTFAGAKTLPAQCIVDQQQELTNGGTSERNLPGYYDGQTFTAGATGLLCEVDVMMFNTMTGTATLNIYSGNGITGTLLATQPVSINVPAGQVWQQWNLAAPPSVTQNSVYTFQFIPVQGGGLPDPYGVNVQGADVYAGGYDLTFTSFDMTFRTYVDVTTGMNELPEENSFAVYPNPNNSKFEIRNSKSEIQSVEIFNLFGQKVFSDENLSCESCIINSALPSGIYFVKIYSGENFFTNKMLIR